MRPLNRVLGQTAACINMQYRSVFWGVTYPTYPQNSFFNTSFFNWTPLFPFPQHGTYRSENFKAFFEPSSHNVLLSISSQSYQFLPDFFKFASLNFNDCFLFLLTWDHTVGQFSKRYSYKSQTYSNVLSQCPSPKLPFPCFLNFCNWILRNFVILTWQQT